MNCARDRPRSARQCLRLTFAEILNEFGNVPLPPYFKRKAEESDKTRYQTIYAQNDGSVAAPTAGLHFTEELLDKIKAKGVKIVEVLLHVGRGTFMPVKVDKLEDHEMHSEIFQYRRTDSNLFLKLTFSIHQD